MSSNPFRFSFLLLLLCVVVFLGTASATSVFLDNPKYDVKTEVGPDAATGGWFIHLGLTGLRVKLTPESPQELEVAYTSLGYFGTDVAEVYSPERFEAARKQVLNKARKRWNELDKSDRERFELTE